MEALEIISQIFGIIGMVFMISSYQVKSQKGLITVQLFGAIFFFINFLLLGVVKGVVGPSIYGNGGYSWRGPGGNGSGYPYRRISPGADSFKWGLKIDQRKLTLAEGGNMPIERGVHLADHDIGNGYDKPGIFCTRFDLVGGNESCNSTNGPYGALGVYGGVRIGEIIAFRHHIPAERNKP